MDEADRKAAEVVKVAPELTGWRKPRGFWVYIGDSAITGFPCTEEEAERIAKPYRDAVAKAIREALDAG